MSPSHELRVVNATSVAPLAASEADDNQSTLVTRLER
jgi:hypothetical protein